MAELTDALRTAGRHGARAAQLATRTPGLVNLLVPGEDRPLIERAIVAEQIVDHATRAMPYPLGPAARVLLGLTGYPLGLDRRRSAAARLLGVQPDTLRRPRSERALFADLAVEVYRRLPLRG